MIVWITHVKVGHRQTSIPKTPQAEMLGGFLLCGNVIAWHKISSLLGGLPESAIFSVWLKREEIR